MYADIYDQTLVLRDGLPVRVRSLRADDAALLAGFFDALSAESREHFRPHTYTPAGAAAVVAEAADPTAIYFLALTPDDEPVGYGFLQGLQRPYPVLGIAVADAWQNRGVGRLLMRFLVSVAGRLDRAGVDLTVDEDNPRAIHVYEETGFKLRRKIRQMRLTF
jgi:ribosomal protein S18 acetylase RimI-like enzyme